MKNKVISYFAILMLAAVTVSGVYLKPALADTVTTTTTATSTTTTATTTATSTSPLNVNIDSIGSKVNQLIDIRGDQSIPSDTKITEEISAQQGILNEIITLSTNEISAIQTKLNDLPAFNKDSKEYSLQSNYLAELSSYNEYFTQESAVVASAVTLSQLQTVAASIKTFRDAGYNNEVYNMVTFTLLYYDASIISTANKRLDSVSSDLTNLDNAQLLLNPYVLNSDVDKAADLINKASSLHDQASGLIIQISPDNSASTTASSTSSSTPSLTASSTASSTPSVSTPDPRDLIEESISDIKSAYQVFIEVADSIKTQLDQ